MVRSRLRARRALVDFGKGGLLEMFEFDWCTWKRLPSYDDPVRILRGAKRLNCKKQR